MPMRGGGMRRAGRRTVRRTRRRRRRRVMLVGGLVGFGIYKMSSRDAERVQEHTGVDPEELTDEELAQAMDELGIEKQEITDEDRTEATAAPAAEQATAGDDPEYLDELQKLADLHAAGILTDEEFADKKRQILGL